MRFCLVVGGEWVVAEDRQEVGQGENDGQEAGGPKANFDLVSLAVPDQVGHAPALSLGALIVVRHFEWMEMGLWCFPLFKTLLLYFAKKSQLCLIFCLFKSCCGKAVSVVTDFGL